MKPMAALIALLVLTVETAPTALAASGLSLWDFDVKSGTVYLSEAWQQRLSGQAGVTHTTFAELSNRQPAIALEVVMALGALVSRRVANRPRRVAVT